MYSVRLGYDSAINRINKLIKNGHHAEGFITSMFTIEKTLRRIFKQLIISTGYNSEVAEKLLKHFKGIDNIMKSWEFFDYKHRKLSDIISSTDYKIIKDATTKRNQMVHGQLVFKKEICTNETKKLLQALENIKEIMIEEYDYSGWTHMKTRKISQLHVDPKVRIK